MIVRTYMTPHPVTLRLDSDFRSALRVMQDHAIHHLPVVDPDDRVLGIVAERDLLLAALHYAGATVDVGDVMHRQVMCVRDDAPITHAAALMARHSIGGLPVVDARERVVGIITEADILRVFVAVLEAKTAREGDAMIRPDGAVVEAMPVVSMGRRAGRTVAPAVPPPSHVKAASKPVKAARRT